MIANHEIILFKSSGVIKVITVLMLLVVGMNSYSQTKELDSLVTVWNNQSLSDSIRIVTIDKYIRLNFSRIPLDSTLYYANLMHDLAKKSSQPLLLSKSLIILGNIDLDKGELNKSKENYQKALSYLNDEKGKAVCFNNLGIIAMKQGNYLKAIEYYTFVQHYFEKNQNKKSLASILNNIAIIYKNLNYYDQSLKYNERSLSLREGIEHFEGVAVSLINIGNIYLEQVKYKEALIMYNKGLAVCEDIGYTFGIATCKHNIGVVHLKQKNYRHALSFLNEGLDIRKKEKFKSGIANSLSNIGRVYFELGEYQKSLRYSKQAVKISLETGVIGPGEQGYETIFLIYQELGDNQKALEAHLKYTNLKDSVINENNKRAIIRQEYELAYKNQVFRDSLVFVQQEKENARAHLNALVIEAEKRKNLYATIGFLILLVLIGYRGYLRKRKLSLVLAEKNQEKTAMLKEIHHRVKNNLQVVNSLLKLQSREIEDEKVIGMFKEAQNRVLSMALLHEKMYRSDDLQHIDIQDHIFLLVEDLIKSYEVEKLVESEVDISVIDIGIRTLIPLGLIINEIITNALKHAFSEENSAKIIVRLKKMEGDIYELIIGDNGIGKDDSQKSTGLGEKLIQIFTKQLKGTFERLEVPGTMYKLSFYKID